MSKLLKLKANFGARKKRKVVGRGNASGHGTYSTRGGKGQTARTGSRRSPGFEGGQTPLARRMPKLKGFNNPNRIKYQVVNLEKLNIFDEGTEIDIKRLHEKGLINSLKYPVKLLGDGEIRKKLIIKVNHASTSAIEKAEKAGAKIIKIKHELP